jgi:hypothetical protein
MVVFLVCLLVVLVVAKSVGSGWLGAVSFFMAFDGKAVATVAAS